MSRRVVDFYTRKASKLGFPARSVWKLNEIQDKFKILSPGMTAADLGCAPGSWTMYLCKVAGEDGRIVGIDRTPLSPEIIRECKKLSPLRVVQENIFKWTPAPVLSRRFDVVASDMAPNTNGFKEIDAMASYELSAKALQLARSLLRKNGTAVIKIFQGKDFEGFHQDVKRSFREVYVFKPEACRKESVETYVIGKGFLG